MGSYRLWERRTASFVSLVVSVATLVVAWSFLEYFNASANLGFGIQYHNINYDTQAILSDFDLYEVRIPSGIRLPSRLFRMINTPDAFKRRQNVQMELSSDMAHHYDIGGELRDAIVFKWRDSVGSRREMLGDGFNNRALWEVEFPKVLDSLADSVTFVQAMRIVISRRCVTVMMYVWNSGAIPAKDIDVTLQVPWVTEPRQLMTQAEVTFLDIKPDRAACSVVNSGGYAKIRLPFLEAGKDAEFEITTSMTNLTPKNVFLDFKTERTINANRIILFTALGVATIYVAPLIFSVVSRAGRRRKSIARKHVSDSEDRKVV